MRRVFVACCIQDGWMNAKSWRKLEIMETCLLVCSLVHIHGYLRANIPERLKLDVWMDRQTPPLTLRAAYTVQEPGPVQIFFLNFCLLSHCACLSFVTIITGLICVFVFTLSCIYCGRPPSQFKTYCCYGVHAKLRI